MTEIPMPGDFEPSETEEEKKGCCGRLCECWCQLLIVIIAFLIIIGLMTSLFWW